MASYGSRLPIELDRLIDLGIIASAVRNAAKPGRAAAEAWVLQAIGPWSAEHIEAEPEAVERDLLAAFAAATTQDPPAPIATSVHRWRYAKSGRLGRDAVWDGERRLGLCGDWLLGGRVEAAWLSGRRLADAVIADQR